VSPALLCRSGLAGAAVVTVLLTPLLITEPAHAVFGSRNNRVQARPHTTARAQPQVPSLRISHEVRAILRNRAQDNPDIPGGIWERFSEDPVPLVHRAWELAHEQRLQSHPIVDGEGRSLVGYEVPMGRTIGHIEEYRRDGTVRYPSSRVALHVDAEGALVAAAPGWPIPAMFFASGTRDRLARHKRSNPNSRHGWGVFDGNAHYFTQDAWQRAKLRGITAVPEINDEGRQVYVYVVPMGHPVGHFEQYSAPAPPIEPGGAPGERVTHRYPSHTVRVTVDERTADSERVIDGEPVPDPIDYPPADPSSHPGSSRLLPPYPDPPAYQP
jgi:hypothetical protein